MKVVVDTLQSSTSMMMMMIMSSVGKRRAGVRLHFFSLRWRPVTRKNKVHGVRLRLLAQGHPERGTVMRKMRSGRIVDTNVVVNYSELPNALLDQWKQQPQIW